jgi:UDP-glucose 4-epimerase
VQILITGATGFIGRHVAKQLQGQGHALALFAKDADHALDLQHSDTVLIQGELGELEPVRHSIHTFNPEVCIHLAWEGIPDFSPHMSKLNLSLSTALLDFVLDNTQCRKVIVAGSCWEYGKQQGACKESDAVKLTSYFTWAKHALNAYLSVKCAEKGALLNWLRLFYVYGPGQRGGSLLPTLIETISQSKVPPIKAPMNKNDFLYVEDVARAFQVAAMKDIPSGVYNLGSGSSTSVYSVCKTAERLITGQSSISEHLKNASEEHRVSDFWADTGKTSKALGWSASTPLEEGIEKHIYAIRRSSQ